MPTEHEGFDIGIKVDLSPIDKAEARIAKFGQNINRLGGNFNKLKFPDSYATGINKAHDATVRQVKETQNLNRETGKLNGDAFNKYGESAGNASKQVEKLNGQSEKINGKTVRSTFEANTQPEMNKIDRLKAKQNSVPDKHNTTFTTEDRTSSVLDRIKNHFTQTNRSARDTEHTIRNFALGGVIANGLSNIASSAYQGAKSFIKQGIAINATSAAINAGFKNMNLSQRQIKGLNNQSAILQKNLGLNGQEVSTMQKQMMNWSTIGYRGSKRLTTAIGAIGAASRMPADQVARLSGSLMRVGASGKVTLSSLSRITRNAPAFYTVLAKGAGMTRGQLMSALKTGKVTQQQFQTWLANGAKTAPKYFKQFAETAGGAMNRIQFGWRSLRKDVTKPLMSVRQSGMRQLATLMNSPAVHQGAHMLGVGVRNIAEWGMKGLRFLSEHRKDVIGTANDFVKIGGLLVKDTWKDFTGIVFDLGKDFGLVNKNAKPGSALHEFRTTLDGLAKNKGAIQTIAHSIILIAGLKGLSTVAHGVGAITSTFFGQSKGGVAGLAKTGVSKYLSLGAKGSKYLGLMKGVGVASIGLEAGGQAINAIRDRHSATRRSQDIGGGIGSAIGGGIAMAINPALAPVGAIIGKYAGRWGGNAVNHFTKGWQRKRPPKSFWSLENLGWSAHNMFKGLNAGLSSTGKKIKTWAGSIGSNIHHGWDKGIKASHDFFRNMPHELGAFGRSVNNNRYVKAFKHGTLFQTAFSDAEKRTRGFRQDFGRTWNSTWQAARNNRYVKAIEHGTFFRTALHDIKSNWQAFTRSFGKGWNNFWGGLSRTKDKVMNNVKAFGNDITYAFGGSKHTFKYKKIPSHAAGTASLVGEAGPELAYSPNAKRARLLGINGPQITGIRANERILNARDTRKVLSGGLGRGLVLKGYANGNTKLSQTAKGITDNYKKITNDSGKQLDKLNRHNKSTWQNVKSSATKNTSQLQHSNRSTWSKITADTNHQTDKTRRNSINDYTNMRKGVNKQMDAMHNGVINTAQSTTKGFGKALNRMDNYAHSAMSNTVKQLNKGISGIDKTLSQFGGNDTVIKPIHFAAGTDNAGRLTHNTLAMVNDASTGPRQEALVTNHNDLVFPHGSNRQMVIPKGWGVLNGSQAQQVANARGLAHFAKGSGMSHSALKKLADKGQSNPADVFAKMYLDNIKAKKPNIQQGETALGENSGKHYGKPWTEAMFTVINNAIGGANGKGGTREAFLHYAESTFTGVKYLMGAASHTLSDCSGMVMQALRHFGINIGRTTVAMQESSGVQYLGKSLSKTLPGDLVIFGHGTGAAGHVGIIKNPRTHTMFNETPPRARVTSIDDDKGMGYGYYRVRGLHNAKPSKAEHADKRLETLAKNELGHSAISWIKKHLSDDLGSLGSFALGGDIGDRARALARGLKKLDPRATKNGIAAILGNWEFESGLNPGAINPGGGASGLGQWLGGRKSALIAYARRHSMSWKNAGAQLSFAVKGDDGNTGILRSILESHSSVASLANRFSSEWERGGYNAQHVHGAMVVRKALGYANGGEVPAGKVVKVGEKGSELAEFKQPVHVYDHGQSKIKIGKLSDRIGQVKPQGKAKIGTPSITININGNISSPATAHKYADIIDEKLENMLERMADEFGIQISTE